MRVDEAQKRQQAQPKASFQQALKKAQKPVVATRPSKLQPKPATAPKLASKGGDVLARSEKASAQNAQVLVGRRAEAEVHRPEIKRIAATIAAILAPELHHAPQKLEQPTIVATPPTPTTSTTPDAAPVPATPPAVRAEALAQKIEQLLTHAELLARAEGPALALSLAEGHAAQVEVVRTGKGEVALRLQARGGDGRRALAGQVAKLRETLAQRGLRVRQVTVC
ncbi:MAG: hypothetical protein JST54_29545 [Deltaproteobacteria bacterium]|nr:hypothetical protein [Deltaproteobacteria bacterium]